MENAVTEGNLPFLNDEGLPGAAQDAAPVQEAAPEPAPPPEEPKGEPAAPPAAVEQADKFIPITALLDEREKRQQAAKEAEELRRKLDEIQRAQEPKAKEPDFYEDPEGRLARERQEMQKALFNERLNISEALARQAHGDELVSAAQVAFAEEAGRNPFLREELQRQANPYGFVVQWHKRQSVLSKLGDDPEAYIEAQVQARLAAMQQQAQPVQSRPAAPPPSLASAPGSGAQKDPPASGFAALFGG